MKNLAFVKETLSKGGYIAEHGQNGKAGGKFLAGGLAGWSLMNIEGRLLLDNVMPEQRALLRECLIIGNKWSYQRYSGTEWRYPEWHEIELKGETQNHITTLNKKRRQQVQTKVDNQWAYDCIAELKANKNGN